MSDLRIRASEVKARGVAERGNFVPPDFIQTIYKYWLAHTNSDKGKKVRYGERKENFCHFWRVVAFWAPLMAVRRGIAAAAPVILTLASIAAVATVAIVLTLTGSWLDLGMIVLMAALILYVGVGLMAGVGVGYELASENKRLRKEQDEYWLYLFAPTSMPAYPAGRFFYWLGRKWKNTPSFRRNTGMTVAVLSVIATVALYVLAFIFATKSALIMTGIIAGATALVAIVGFIGVHIADYVNGKRKIAEEAEAEFKASLDENEYYEYMRLAQEPSNFAKFMIAIGDVIVFTFQVIRVNKWKICPLVDIDTNEAVSN